MNIKPQIFTETKTLGDLNILFEGERYRGEPNILDTKVSINGELLCWITWENKDEFYTKLNDVIGEYRI